MQFEINIFANEWWEKKKDSKLNGDFFLLFLDMHVLFEANFGERWRSSSLCAWGIIHLRSWNILTAALQWPETRQSSSVMERFSDCHESDLTLPLFVLQFLDYCQRVRMDWTKQIFDLKTKARTFSWRGEFEVMKVRVTTTEPRVGLNFWWERGRRERRRINLSLTEMTDDTVKCT